MIYLDHHTTTKPSPEVLSEMMPFFEKHWGTPIAPHQQGNVLLPFLKNAYDSLYALVSAPSDAQFIFTSSGAEAINHVVFSTYLNVTRQTGKNHFVTSTIEEAPLIMSMERLQDLGCAFDMAPVNKQGKITAESIAEIITPRTALVSLSWANAMTGVIQPLEEIAALCRDRGILFHVDVTHALGKGHFSFAHLEADFLTFNGEHLQAPKGTGGLFIHSGIEISPFIIGGNEQAGLRGGSFNVPAFVGLGVAATQALKQQEESCLQLGLLRHRFEESLKKAIPSATIFFEQEDRLPHISCIGFPHVTSDALLFLLQRQQLFASLGGGNFQKLHLLLEACGIESHGALSFGFSSLNSSEEVDKAVRQITETWTKLRRCWQRVEVTT